MRFEWDENKNQLNIKKHGISFNLAMRVFLDDKRIERVDLLHSTIFEERTIVIGRVQNLLVLFVVVTTREGKIRLISARRAEKKEEAEYYENENSRRATKFTPCV